MSGRMVDTRKRSTDVANRIHQQKQGHRAVTMRTKNDTIAEIIMLNPTAQPSFLAEFANQDLDEYLGRLRQTERSRNPVVQGLDTAREDAAAAVDRYSSGY